VSAGAASGAPGPAARPVRIAYFAHDLSHADIPRRVEMLVRGGADVRVLGFRRGEPPPFAFVDLGRTEDGRLAARAASVARAILTLPRWARSLEGAEVVVARNLEMLAVAAAARRFGARRAKLIYECLDIHRLLSGAGLGSRLLRGLERLLLARVDGLLVSSPGFVREHFARLATSLPPVVLVENKVGVNEAVPPRRSDPPPPGPPWRIGWFGVIRCKRSLDLLAQAARERPGLLEVAIAGRPALGVVGDLSRDLPPGSGVTYLGAFADEAELARLYRSVHFAWLIDFYESGANSDWLLPNRLYRSIYYGAPPIALGGVETGRWLEAHEAGFRLARASPETLIALLSGLAQAEYLAARARLDEIPTEALVHGREECVALVARLAHPGESAAAD
jgi:hypothetical protein